MTTLLLVVIGKKRRRKDVNIVCIITRTQLARQGDDHPLAILVGIPNIDLAHVVTITTVDVLTVL